MPATRLVRITEQVPAHINPDSATAEQIHRLFTLCRQQYYHWPYQSLEHARGSLDHKEADRAILHLVKWDGIIFSPSQDALQRQVHRLVNAAWLGEERRKQRLTMAEVNQRLGGKGLGGGAVTYWESGKRTISPKNMIRLYNVLMHRREDYPREEDFFK